MWNGSKFLCTWTDNVGYKQALLYKNGKRHYKRVHRLVAEAYIPNSDNTKTQVNHINSNKTDNNVDNLEWVTNSKNTKHGYESGVYEFKSRSHAVVCEHKTTKETSKFKSVRQASKELGLNRKTITAILKNEKANNYDYSFRYCDSMDKEG